MQDDRLLHRDVSRCVRLLAASHRSTVFRTGVGCLCHQGWQIGCQSSTADPREDNMTKEKSSKSTTRRKFLRGAAAASAATMTLPTVVKAEDTITWRWQSTWG